MAFVTLATDNDYALGALVLGHSLRKVNTKYNLVVLITNGIDNIIRSQLNYLFDLVQVVNPLDSKDEVNLKLAKRPDLGVTFTKLHCWRLTQFPKCVFLDADTLVIQNCDELFEKEELSAVPDVGWPDCFNSGVFVFQPSDKTYNNLVQFADEKGSFDGGDQGLLNMFFHDWSAKNINHHLSFIYNMNTSTTYTYMPAYKQFGSNIKIIHFLGAVKPWMLRYNESTDQVEHHEQCHHQPEHLKMWWNIFTDKVKPHLHDQFVKGDIAEEMSNITLQEVPSTQESSEKPLSNLSRQFAWECGEIDYLGADAFENIQRKLDDAINGTPKYQE